MAGWPEQRDNGTWRGVYRDPQGRKRSKSGFRYKGEAKAWADAEEEKAFSRGSEPEGPKSFGQYAEEWLARRTGKAPATTRRYRSAVIGIVESAPFSGTPIGEVTAADMELWFGAMDAPGSGVGVPTRNYRLSVLRMMFKQARTVDKIRNPEGMVMDDPTAGLRAARQRSGKRRRLFLTEPEVAAMLAAARAYDPTGNDYLLALLGVDAGLRWGEVAALSVDDVHLDETEPYLWIWRSVVRSTGEIQETTKNGEPRVVPIGSAVLRDALRSRVEEVLLLHGPGSLLLPRTMADPRPLAYSTQERHFAEIVARSGIARQPMGWHDFRHTFGSRLAARNVDIAIIAQVLGHSSLDVTRLYVHASAGSVRHREVSRALGLGC